MAGTNPDRGVSVSTVLGRRLGGELLRMREACGLRQAAAAEALTASVAKVAKMERGLVPMRDPDVRALCHLYGEHDEEAISRLLELAKTDRGRRKAKGWWNQYPELGSLIEYVALEDIARGVRTWQGSMVPGLLQTPAYAHALAVGNAYWEDPEEIERFVAAKMARQGRLSDSAPLELWAVVGEGALRQLVGGREVMREQLTHLVDVSELPNVKLQVVPFLAGSHPGLSSTFSIVTFADAGAMDVVYAETTSSILWLESQADALRHDRTFDRIVRNGLVPQDSIALIKEIRREL
ncbi:helix-turn-helix domain-containing protein [Streptomyces sp. LP05-1]|uniref:Helix-turn-helix domain-containing protein n=1 Tax=Streptomyces pyxinae TaxID=2970734 RepID=A0ABT2CGE0_9ACTN|nr:helix-turn-helix transcriptional regulator [Streptomyces sp. LP05-1]MCS0636456.1 helix-turn-helix domain-containing protein [Streptomyces sp. LP05-1]